MKRMSRCRAWLWNFVILCEIARISCIKSHVAWSAAFHIRINRHRSPFVSARLFRILFLPNCRASSVDSPQQTNKNPIETHRTINHFLNSTNRFCIFQIGDHFVGRRMWLFECTAVLLQIKLLGYTEIDGARLFDRRNFDNRSLLAIFIQCAHVELVGVRAV